MNKARPVRSAYGLTACALIAVVAACDQSNPLSVLCCTKFKVGADLSSTDFGLTGRARGDFLAFAQAASDLASAAHAALIDVQTACRDIAIELGASAADLEAAEQKPERERTRALCGLAVGQIEARVVAHAEVDVAFAPPVCAVSVQARARCEGQCSAEGTCDVRLNPPVCRGGTLEIVCKGECVPSAGASLYCEGTCAGSCNGQCVAQGGVRCNGRCEGTCTAEGSPTNQAFDAAGNCVGTCQGTCASTPPGVHCAGACKGQCDTACRAEASATVTCDGTCSGDYAPLRCRGGTLEGGCDVNASCKANCNASAAARAECTAPVVHVRTRAAADAALGRAIQVLETTLPPLLVVLEARGRAFVELATNLAAAAGTTGSAVVQGELGVEASACLVPIAATIADAAANATVSLEASADVLASLGVR